jgi:hypothetical protein
MKSKLKKQAIKMRKKGMTYSEILKKVPVAKSTLSLWLRSVGLAKKEKQIITKKRLEAGKRGGRRKREIRIEKTKEITKEAKKEINDLTKRDLWLMGIMLHWAEGTKPKEHSPSMGIEFGNSDYRMVWLYIKWLIDILGVVKSDIILRLYIHESSRDREEEVLVFWSKVTGISRKKFYRTYFKKHNPKTVRKNIGKNYRGTLSIKVRKSTDLNRKIIAWTEAIYENYCRIV